MFSKIYHRLRNVIYGFDNDDFFAEKIVKYAQDNNIRIIWFGYGNISYKLICKIKILSPCLKLVCDTDSVWSRFILRELPLQEDESLRKDILIRGKKKEDEEKILVNLCDITTAVSCVDADYYRAISDNPSRVHIFSNVIDSEDYKNTNIQILAKGERQPTIFLGGTFGHVHSPMDTATRWVLECVLPLVVKEIPEIRLLIVGRDSDVGFGHIKDNKIQVTGKVHSVLPYLLNSDVAIVPLKFESGTRFKILEAGICGVPIVSTSLGAEGLEVVDGESILIADDAENFARAIIKCINEATFSKKVADECKNLIELRYGLATLAHEANQILATLAIE